jgi:two-component system cell cycle response regulator CtrA
MLIAGHDPVAHTPNALSHEMDCRHLTALRSTRVLLLANDMMPSGSVAPSLTDADCRVTQAGTVDAMIALTKADDFDLIVVDFRPDVLGYQAVRQLRMAHIDIPILFVSARSTSDAFDRAYAVGADDVAVLPLDRAELKIRMASLAIGAGARGHAHTMRVGRLEIDLAGRYARVDGKPLPLYSDEYAAFELLVSRNGAPVGKGAILKHAYDDEDLTAQGDVDTLMSRLRRKLAAAGAGDPIQTVRRLGYALGNGHAPHTV